MFFYILFHELKANYLKKKTSDSKSNKSITIAEIVQVSTRDPFTSTALCWSFRRSAVTPATSPRRPSSARMPMRKLGQLQGACVFVDQQSPPTVAELPISINMFINCVFLLFRVAFCVSAVFFNSANFLDISTSSNCGTPAKNVFL